MSQLEFLHVFSILFIIILTVGIKQEANLKKHYQVTNLDLNCSVKSHELKPLEK